MWTPGLTLRHAPCDGLVGLTGGHRGFKQFSLHINICRGFRHTQLNSLVMHMYLKKNNQHMKKKLSPVLTSEPKYTSAPGNKSACRQGRGNKRTEAVKNVWHTNSFFSICAKHGGKKKISTKVPPAAREPSAAATSKRPSGSSLRMIHRARIWILETATLWRNHKMSLQSSG